MRSKRFAATLGIILCVTVAALVVGCSSDSSGNVYDWRGSYICSIGELTASQQQSLQLTDGTLGFQEPDSSSRSAETSNGCNFWANVQGGGGLAMVGTYSQSGDQVTCNLAPAANTDGARAAESVTIVMEGNGETGSGHITLVDDGVSYTGTIEVERYPGQD